MGKNTLASRRKGPMALVLAAVVALGAGVLGLDPDALRQGDTSGNQQLPPASRPVDGGTASAPQTVLPEPGGAPQWASFLPVEAQQTAALIQRGGPFPHRQDGTTFGNRERRLPARERGWYREYTVPTPGLSHRGARRIVTGGHPPREWYYTADHYDSFRSFTPPARTH